MAELKKEYSDAEIVGLCMNAAISHAGHVLNEAVRLSPEEGVACSLPGLTEDPEEANP